MDEQALKELALHDELRMASDLIQQGFGELQEMKFEDTFYYVPHQLLASGFERVMKCFLILKYESDNGSFPSTNKLKRWGHSLDADLTLVIGSGNAGQKEPHQCQH